MGSGLTDDPSYNPVTGYSNSIHFHSPVLTRPSGRNRSDYTTKSRKKSSEFLILCHIRCKVENEKSS